MGGIEAYYNNSDNICYMTYCTKCVHEHGLYVRLETDEEETKGAKSMGRPKSAKKNLKQRKCKKNVKTLWILQKLRVVLNQRTQIQCQECSRADLIMRFSGCRKVPQTKRSDKRSANLRELFTRIRTGTPGLERPLPKSSRHSAACPKKHNFLCQKRP